MIGRSRITKLAITLYHTPNTITSPKFSQLEVFKIVVFLTFTRNFLRKVGRGKELIEQIPTTSTPSAILYPNQRTDADPKPTTGDLQSRYFFL